MIYYSIGNNAQEIYKNFNLILPYMKKGDYYIKKINDVNHVVYFDDKRFIFFSTKSEIYDENFLSCSDVLNENYDYKIIFKELYYGLWL